MLIDLRDKLKPCPFCGRKVNLAGLQEVVQCKDCRYWAYDCEGDFGIKYGRCSRWADAWGEHEPETTDRDYCSYADRKTEPQQVTSKLGSVENTTVSACESTMSQQNGKLKTEPQTETPHACKICPYHEQCSAEDWRSCRYDYVAGRYIEPQTERSE